MKLLFIDFAFLIGISFSFQVYESQLRDYISNEFYIQNKDYIKSLNKCLEKAPECLLLMDSQSSQLENKIKELLPIIKECPKATEKLNNYLEKEYWVPMFAIKKAKELKRFDLTVNELISQKFSNYLEKEALKIKSLTKECL